MHISQENKIETRSLFRIFNHPIFYSLHSLSQNYALALLLLPYIDMKLYYNKMIHLFIEKFGMKDWQLSWKIVMGEVTISFVHHM